LEEIRSIAVKREGSVMVWDGRIVELLMHAQTQGTIELSSSANSSDQSYIQQKRITRWFSRLKKAPKPGSALPSIEFASCRA
jgi:hypothetical protein